MNLSGQNQFSCENSVVVDTPIDQVFAYLDDPKRLASHMEESSWMMAGSHMKFDLDEKGGREIGSKITMTGKILGIPLLLNEVIHERTPPNRKTWKTSGPQKLIILDQYTMGFELQPIAEKTSLRVFIDYSIPQSGLFRLLGLLLGGYYARWCTEKMVTDAARNLSRTHLAASEPVR